ncbi:MAG: hypothetical protein ACRD8O_02630 [Bryobacteraceae bacterium]
MTQEELRGFLESEYGLKPQPADPFVRSAGIHSQARIGRNVRFGRDVVVHENVEIADDVEIGDRVTLRNCRLGGGVRVEENCVIGYRTLTGGFTHKLDGYREVTPTLLGENTLVRTGAVVYQSVVVGEHCWINHMVLLREQTRIGHHTSIGTMTDSEGYNSIGSHVAVHSQVQLCARLLIEDYVFVAPMTVFANGNPMGYARPHLNSSEQGGIVRFGAMIAAGVIVMPRVEIGYEAIVGPGSVVNRDVPNLTVVMGYPIRNAGLVPPEQRMPAEIRRGYYGGSEEPPPPSAIAAVHTETKS